MYANFINRRKYADALAGQHDYPVVIRALFIDDTFGYRIRRFDETDSDEEDIYDIFISNNGIYHIDEDEGGLYHLGSIINANDITTPDWIVWCKIQSDLNKGTKTLIEESLGEKIYNLWMDPSRLMFGFTIANDDAPIDIFGFYGTQLSFNESVPRETFDIVQEVFYGICDCGEREFAVKYYRYDEMPFDWWDPDTNQHIHATGYAVAGYYADGRITEFSTEYENNESWCHAFSMEVTEDEESEEDE